MALPVAVAVSVSVSVNERLPMVSLSVSDALANKVVDKVSLPADSLRLMEPLVLLVALSVSDPSVSVHVSESVADSWESDRLTVPAV